MGCNPPLTDSSPIFTETCRALQSPLGIPKGKSHRLRIQPAAPTFIMRPASPPAKHRPLQCSLRSLPPETLPHLRHTHTQGCQLLSEPSAQTGTLSCHVSSSRRGRPGPLSPHLVACAKLGSWLLTGHLPKTKERLRDMLLRWATQTRGARVSAGVHVQGLLWGRGWQTQGLCDQLWNRFWLALRWRHGVEADQLVRSVSLCV